MNKTAIILLLFTALLFAGNTSGVISGVAPKTGSATRQSVDSAKKQVTTVKTDTVQNNQGGLAIDTSTERKPMKTVVPADTARGIDSSQIAPLSENTLTNTKLLIYILLSVLGLLLFFYIFVITLFKTFHKTRSTRQSLLLSWNLFFIVTIIWIFIVWGLAAGFWTVASFMIVVIFLFIISLIMTIIAVKSK